MKKRLCLLLCCLLALCPALSRPPALAAGEDAPSAIRVLLRRLSMKERADLTFTGTYLARSASGTELLLASGTKAAVLLENGSLILHAGGVSADMGKSLSLLRQSSGETTPGIHFNLQPGFYPGDLLLTAGEDGISPVLTLPLETYLKGVVPYEMGDGFPEEALKAQAVCARTYALSHLNPKNAFDVVDTTNDQVFRGLSQSSPKSDSAVDATAGLVLQCEGKLITAWYSASNGGQTELPANVWPGEAPRCFEMKDDPWDAANPDATVRTCTVNRDASGLSPAFVKLLRQALLRDPLQAGRVPDEAGFRVGKILSLELEEPRFPAPSRLMTRLKVTFESSGLPPAPAPSGAPEDEEELDIRELLSALPHTVTLDLFPEAVIALGLSVSGANNEIVSVREEEDAFVLTAGRFGHGVGLSQRGAQQMAREGEKTFRQILAFYYPGASLEEYAAKPGPLPTPPPLLAGDPGPAPTATPKPTLMPVTGELPEGARLAKVANISRDSSLNLRSQPSAGAEVLLRLYFGQPLVVLEPADVPGWVRVKTDAAEGFVMESFLVYEDAAPAAAAPAA